MTAYNASRFRAPGDYDITWGSIFMGAVDEVDPSGIEMETKIIKVVDGRRCPGRMDRRPKGDDQGHDPGNRRDAVPELKTLVCVGLIPMIPATFHADLYSYAQKLTLHPTDVSGTAEDITLLKSFPMFKFPKRKGDDEDTHIEAEWRFWPDRSQLVPGSLLLAYGTIGP